MEQSFAPGLQHSQRAASISFVVDICSVLLITLAALFVAIASYAYTYDDAFITYRYAYNFATGQGFVYNSGEWFLGTTAPLYGLLLGVLGWVCGADAIPHISGWISGVALLATGLALYAYGRFERQPFCGFLAGMVFVTSRFLPITFGGEMLFQAALIIWAMLFYRMDRTMLAALLLALAILVRLDSLIAAGVIGGHYLLVRRRLPWREVLVAAVVLLPFSIISARLYGSFLPGTLAAKLAQRDSGLWSSFLHGLFHWFYGFSIQGGSTLFSGLVAAPYGWLWLLLSGIGVPALVLWYRFWLLPLAWVVLYTLGYALLNVPFYHWYVVPVVLAMALLIACGMAGMVELLALAYARIRRGSPLIHVRQTLMAVSLLLLLPVVVAQLAQTRSMAGDNPIEVIYEQTGAWFAQNTPADASIGYLEIGRVGYYAQRTVIDPLGLVNPGVAPHVAQKDLTWAYAQYRPTYIIHSDRFAGWFADLFAQPWFQQEYHQIEVIGPAGSDLSLSIYQRIPLGSD